MLPPGNDSKETETKPRGSRVNGEIVLVRISHTGPIIQHAMYTRGGTGDKKFNHASSTHRRSFRGALNDEVRTS